MKRSNIGSSSSSWLWVALAGCSGRAPEDSGVAVEPIVVPDDASARGVPVGVQTFVVGDVTLEVWYPAPDAVADQATEGADFGQFLPPAFTAHVGEITLPSPDTGAVRGAAVRETGGRLPVVLFSHGFGGFRLQSFDLTAHLASRGYVVVAPDHPGRMMGDVLPCLFSPPLEGCDLSGFLEDPAQEELAVALAWLSDGPLASRLDSTRLGLMGHSAGGGSTTRIGDADARFLALLPMAGGDPVPRDVPTLFVDGACDGIVPAAATQAAAAASADALHARIAGAGHLAFSDLCALELDALAAEYLEGREDLNGVYYEQLLALGIDGCPSALPAKATTADPSCASDEGFLDLETSAPIVRSLATRFFDLHLQATGAGVLPGEETFPALTVTAAAAD